jgi:ribonuclease BN (tRNA processing enzyme)
MVESVTVTILGSGTIVPSLARSTCSFLLEAAGQKLLFDIGPGTMRRLLEAGTSINEIDLLLLSHLHPDHSGELVSFFFAAKYPETYRRRCPFTLVGARGLRRFFEGLTGVYGDWIVLPEDLFSLRELDNRKPDALAAGQLAVRSRPMAHTESSIGYRVEAPGGIAVAYSGDTDLCDGLVKLAANADLFICECSLPDGMKIAGHLTPSEAGEAAARAGAKRLVLTHFYPECDGVDIEAQCRKTWQGPLTLAEDLMRIEIAADRGPSGQWPVALK